MKTAILFSALEDVPCPRQTPQGGALREDSRWLSWAFLRKVERRRLWKTMSERRTGRATGTFAGHTNLRIKALGTDSLKLCTPTHHVGSLLVPRKATSSPVEDYWSLMAPISLPGQGGAESPEVASRPPRLSPWMLSVFSRPNCHQGQLSSVPLTEGNKREVRRVHFTWILSGKKR